MRDDAMSDELPPPSLDEACRRANAVGRGIEVFP